MMKRLLLIAAILAAFGCTGCGETPVIDLNGKEGGNEQQGGKVDEEEPVDQGEDAPDLTGFGKVSLKSEITHVQPMTGIILWTDSNSTKSWLTLEYSYMKYNDICKEKDKYDWTAMDNLLNKVAGRGHQLVVRFCYTYPGKFNSVPDYIKTEEGYEGITYKSEDGRAEYPDWRSEELKRFHKDFHRRFAERYDDDPRLAFVETGFGHWGEYHVYGGKFIAGQTFPSKDFQAEFLSDMDGWFKHTPWMISIDAADDYYAPFHKQASLLELNFGNFDDSFMCEDHDGYNRECWTFFGKERYKKAPLGGEFSYYSSYDQKHCLDAAGMYGRVFEDEVAKFHMTFIIGADQPGKQTDARIQEAAMSMGYRFEVKDFRVKDGEALVCIANVGVAPIYRHAYVAVNGVRGDYSLRYLMPGERTWVRITDSGISASSCTVSIECDHLVPKQKGIEFQANIE